MLSGKDFAMCPVQDNSSDLLKAYTPPPPATSHLPPEREPKSKQKTATTHTMDQTQLTEEQQQKKIW